MPQQPARPQPPPDPPRARQRWQALRCLLAGIEPLLLLAAGKQERPTLWIVGPPRSGTTLLYQVITQGYRVAYFPNLLSSWHRSPVAARLLARIFTGHGEGRSEDAFHSDFGKTRGRWAPHEMGELWYRWFPRGDHIYVGPGELAPAKRRSLSKQIQGYCAWVGAPGVFKNTYHTMRLAPLSEAFPRALFLVCRRDPLDLAQSILKSRIQNQKDRNRWWSLPPREIDQIRQHPYWRQVVEQAYYSYRQIEADRRHIGGGRFLDVSYRDLCLDPRRTMGEIEAFWQTHGVSIQRRDRPLPEHFPYSSGRQVDEEEYRKIRLVVEELWPDKR